MPNLKDIFKVVTFFALAYAIFLILLEIDERMSAQIDLIIVQHKYIKLLEKSNTDLTIENFELFNKVIILETSIKLGGEFNHNNPLDSNENIGVRVTPGYIFIQKDGSLHIKAREDDS